MVSFGEYSDEGTASTTQARDYKGATDLVTVGFNARQDPDAWADRTGPLDTDGGTQAVAFGGDIARTLQARHDSSPCADRGMDVVASAMQVRRLTPRECERLQGFPDDYTLVPNRGKPTADGPRYKALGNSMAVPVMRWIGERIFGLGQK
jgi:DNA (cytosine-5)-methyltransferase 1